MINGCQNNSIVIKAMCSLAIIFIMSLFAVRAYAEDNPKVSKRLILFQGFVLHAYFDDKYVEVKRLPPEHATFYGYGWIDDHTVFVAYQPEGIAEAIADFEIVDLRGSRTTKLDGIGGMGESNFDVNPTTGDIVFGTGDDIKLLKLNAKRDSYRIQDIKKNVSCWAVFWIDSKTVGCKRAENDRLVKYVVPSK